MSHLVPGMHNHVRLGGCHGSVSTSSNGGSFFFLQHRLNGERLVKDSIFMHIIYNIIYIYIYIYLCVSNRFSNLTRSLVFLEDDLKYSATVG